jgi:hypothetical protein
MPAARPVVTVSLPIAVMETAAMIPPTAAPMMAGRTQWRFLRRVGRGPSPTPA